MPRATARSLIGLLVPVAILAACLPVVSGTADARTSGSTASSALHPLPALDHSAHGSKLVSVIWNAGRAWFVVGSRRGLTVTSTRVRGRVLASPVTSRVQAPLGWYPLAVGSELLYSTARRSTGVAALRADGKVGPARPASPDPMETDVGVPVAALRLGERLVWALAGGIPIGEGLNYRPSLHVCCDEAGSAVDLTSLISRRPAPRDHALGVDAQGRVWLAWADRLGARVVQLDGTTLKRITPKALTAPVLGSFKMACARTCRLVIEAREPNPTGGLKPYFASWSPGERSATRLKLAPVPKGVPEFPQLLDADFRSGRLAVAYLQQRDSGSSDVNVVVGDARGARAQLRGRVEVPQVYSGLPLYERVGGLTPSGYVVGLGYSRGLGKVRMAAIVAPLR